MQRKVSSQRVAKVSTTFWLRRAYRSKSAVVGCRDPPREDSMGAVRLAGEPGLRSTAHDHII